MLRMGDLGQWGVAFSKAGIDELTDACRRYNTLVKDGEAVITLAF